MMSYWELQSFSAYDHVVIGAGIVGLSVAIELADKFKGQRIAVLERGLLPTGASSRNAGFACMGSVTELLDDLQTMSEQEVVALFALRKTGLELLRKRLGDTAIGYAANGSYELINSDELGALDKIDHLNRLLLPVTGSPAFRMADDKIEQCGFDSGFTRAMIENVHEGELHTGKMLRALTDLAISKGIEIKTGAEADHFTESAKGVEVAVTDAFRKEQWVLHCSTVTISTNAFTKQLLPQADVIPGRGQVLITHPIPGLKFKGVYHFDKGFYYFRELDGRVLIGGGRNLDFAGETTTDIALSTLIQIDLEQKLADIILPHTHFEVAQRWSGIMAFGSTKQPIVKAYSNRVFGCFRMGGMGVAIGSEVARQVVGLIAQ